MHLVPFSQRQATDSHDLTEVDENGIASLERNEIKGMEGI
jgi:hypothetical protein